MDLNASQYLKAIQKASGMTQAQLSRRLNVTELTVNSWINEKATPRQRAFENIQVLYYELVGREDLDSIMRDAQIEKALDTKFPLKKILSDKNLLELLTVHFTYNTNSIEGSTMTYSDTEALLLEKVVPENRTVIEQAEARNHQSTLLWILDSLGVNAVDFSHDFLLDIHLRLMNSVHSGAGTYRNHAVRIANSRTTLANPQSIQTKLDNLFIEMNRDEIDRNDVISHIAHTHALFEQIHPFSDGNGRVGRLLMLKMAIKHNVMPPLVVREKRSAYYSYLEQAQTKDKYDGLDYFIASAMLDMNEILS